MKKLLRSVFIIPLLLLAVACSSNPTVATGGDPELDAKARAALKQLFETTPAAQTVRSQAKAVLVFPSVVKAGFMVGGEDGTGVMFDRDGTVVGYYGVRGVSFGLQAGAQTYSQAMFLMTDAAITELTSDGGLSVGVGPSVVVVDAGMAKSFTTTTMKSDVYAFIFGQEGLMAGLGVQGQRIRQLE